MSKRKSEHVPPFRVHKGSGQGSVVLDGKRLYLGLYDRQQSKRRDDCLIAE